MITGAAGSIGLAVARLLCAEGARVTLADLPGPALRAASEKAARQGDQFQFCSEMVAFYAKARTYFSTKC